MRRAALAVLLASAALASPAGQPQNWGFRRDDNQTLLTVTNGDFFDAIRFVVKPGDVFGDMKPYVLIDDIQVFEKD